MSTDKFKWYPEIHSDVQEMLLDRKILTRLLVCFIFSSDAITIPEVNLLGDMHIHQNTLHIHQNILEINITRIRTVEERY